jgi:uncharacterized protein
MTHSEIDVFPAYVAEKLQVYVYRLIDPRNGETFYVGKGQGNRVFAHVRDELNQHDGAEDDIQLKLTRIREIRLAVNRSALNRSLYEATRYAWKLKKSRAAQAEVVLATRLGLIVGAFIPRRWLDATPENFQGREPSHGRIGFEGDEASARIRKLYVGKRVPDQYRKPGAAFPVNTPGRSTIKDLSTWEAAQVFFQMPYGTHRSAGDPA